MVEVDIPMIIDSNGRPVLGTGVYREFFKEKTQNFVFRKVKDVRPGQLISVNFTTVNQEGEELKKDQKDKKIKFTPDEYKRNVKEYHSSGTFTTFPIPMRKETDKFNGVIFGNMQNLAELNIGNLEFGRQTDPEYKFVMPRVDDLVCGTVETHNGEYHFTNWFICSDQFLKAWTAIMFDAHESFVKKGIPIDKGEELKRYFFGGNYLMTNGYLKFVLSCHESNITPTHKQLKDRYYNLRTEAVSRNYVHLYTAMVLIARYGEWPCDLNVPNNYDNGPKMVMWDLPPNWLSYIAKVFGIQTEDYKMQIDIKK
jgi:hypothetical protein